MQAAKPERAAHHTGQDCNTEKLAYLQDKTDRMWYFSASFDVLYHRKFIGSFHDHRS